MPAVTRIGDNDKTHCSGMSRAQGSPNVYCNGIPVSRQGDNNTVHLKPPAPCTPHAASITDGSSSVKVNGNGLEVGLGIGRVGDAISSCTSVAVGSPNVFAGG
jgi:uncharacterized Zn-binding protein involved in type VI secretion